MPRRRYTDEEISSAVLVYIIVLSLVFVGIVIAVVLHAVL